MNFEPAASVVLEAALMVVWTRLSIESSVLVSECV